MATTTTAGRNRSQTTSSFSAQGPLSVAVPALDGSRKLASPIERVPAPVEGGSGTLEGVGGQSLPPVAANKSQSAPATTDVSDLTSFYTPLPSYEGDEMSPAFITNVAATSPVSPDAITTGPLFTGEATSDAVVEAGSVGSETSGGATYRLSIEAQMALHSKSTTASASDSVSDSMGRSLSSTPTWGWGVVAVGCVVGCVVLVSSSSS